MNLQTATAALAEANACTPEAAPWWAKIMVGFVIAAAGLGVVIWNRGNKSDDKSDDGFTGFVFGYGGYVAIVVGLAIVAWGMGVDMS